VLFLQDTVFVSDEVGGLLKDVVDTFLDVGVYEGVVDCMFTSFVAMMLWWGGIHSLAWID
jgi:hypothetical protein